MTNEAKRSEESVLTDLLSGMFIYVEHGYVTIRDDKGWLLWESRVEKLEMPTELETPILAAYRMKRKDR